MSKSNSSNKKKIAIALMSTLFCAGNGNRNNISAMNTIEKNKTQSSQTLAAVGGAAVRNNQSSKQGLTKNQKLAIVAAIAALVVVPAIGFTIWGVKKHLDSKGGPDQRKDTEDDGQKSKNPKSGKKGKDKENEEGYDYVTEVCKRLNNGQYSSVLKPFNDAVTKIKSCEFGAEEAEQLAEFLKVVKGEKKVLEKGVSGPFTFGQNSIFVDLDDGMTYGLYFKIRSFEILKCKGTSEIYSLDLSYDK